MAREFLRITKEAVAGTFDAAATATYLIDIDGSNGYTVRPAPIIVTQRTAAAANRRGAQVARKNSLTGNLAFTVRGSYADLLADWCVGTSGGTVQATYTVDHAIQLEDSGATVVRSRDLGMYVQQMGLNCNEQDQWLKATLQLVGLNRTVPSPTDFAEPALADYPTDAFLCFEDATAGLSLHGETRMDIEQFNITLKNMLDVRYFLGSFPQKIRPCGRDADAAIRLSYKTQVPRSHLEAQTPGVCSITFDNGPKSLAINFQGATYFASVNDQIDNSKTYLQECTLEAHLDYAAGDDFSMVVGT